VSGFFQCMKQKSRVFFKCWASKKTSDKFVEVSKRLIPKTEVRKSIVWLQVIW
jgi:hypothetical protein